MLPVSYLGVESCAQNGYLSISPHKENVVLWMRYNHVHRTFTMEHKVLAAAFAKYSKCRHCNDEWAVIACEDMSLHSYNLTNGESRVLGLKFRPQTMTPCGTTGIVISYRRKNRGSLDLALIEGPEVFPRAIVPSSVCAPLHENEELKIVTEKYMLVWSEVPSKMFVYSINLIPQQKITKMSGNGSATPVSARPVSSEGSEYNNIRMFSFDESNGITAKGAVFSPVCEWFQESSGVAFPQFWGSAESLISQDPIAKKFYVFSGSDVFAFQGAAHVAPIAGICDFPAVAIIGESGNMHVGFFSSPDSECIPLSLKEQIAVADVKCLKTEPAHNWCMVIYNNPAIKPTHVLVDLDMDNLSRRCFSIIVELQGPAIAVTYLPTLYSKFHMANQCQFNGMIEFMSEFIASVRSPSFASQLIVYLHMLSEEFRLCISDATQHDDIKSFIAPYVQQWGEHWRNAYRIHPKGVRKGNDLSEHRNLNTANKNIDGDDSVRSKAQDKHDSNGNSPVTDIESSFRFLPCIVENPPNVFESIINCMDPTDGTPISADFSSLPHLFPISSALIGIFHASATQKSTQRIAEYINTSGILSYTDHLVPGLRTCLLEMCCFLKIDIDDSGKICHSKNTNDSDQHPRISSLAYSLFDKDFRYKECQRLLQVHEPQKCLLGIYMDGDDEKLNNGQIIDSWAYRLAARALAGGYGKSATEFNSRRPMLWEQMEPVNINFEGECTETGISIPPCYDSLNKAADEDPWGVFSHGVALGLSVFPKSPGIDSLWVVSSVSLREESNELYSGFVYGMGLCGHLSSLEDWQFYESLVNTNTSGTVAALLGVGASKMGSRDSKLTKVLAVHIRALLPEGAAYNNSMVPPQVERAALISLGLLYFGQGVRHLSDVMLRELCSTKSRLIGKNSQENIVEERLGGLKRLRPVDTILDGEGSENNFAYKMAVGITLGLINHGKSTKSGLEPLFDYVSTHFDRSVDSSEIENGALLALMLAYAGSNNKTVAERTKLPTTIHALKYASPSTIFLRALVHHIIMWDEIKADKTWIESQISEVLKQTLDGTTQPSSTMKLYYYYALTGILIALAMRYCGSGNENAVDVLLYYTREVIEKKYIEKLEEMAQSRTSTNIPSNMRRNTAPRHFVEYPLLNAAQNLAKLLSSLALAMSAVASGTGNLKILRMLREFYQIGPQVQALYDPEMVYVPEADLSFPQISQAIGWLFLAEGTCAFKSDPLSVSMLACFSFLPLSGGSNINIKEWEHLYFFWALVTEKRCLFVQDAPNAKVHVEVHIKDGQVIPCSTPYHLPPLSSISHIDVVDDNYIFQRVENCEGIVTGASPGLKLETRKYVGGTLRAILERESHLGRRFNMSYRQDAWEMSQIDMLKATLRTMAKAPTDIAFEWDIEVLLTFYERWPQTDEKRILKKRDVEELRLLRWLR